jgi:hypothetical protein
MASYDLPSELFSLEYATASAVLFGGIGKIIETLSQYGGDCAELSGMDQRIGFPRCRFNGIIDL